MKLFLKISVLLVLVSCSTDPWTEKEQKTFVNECLAEGGTKSYCECYKTNAMNAFKRYEDVTEMSFEKAVELSINCK
jgi:hypothetical protein